MSSRLFHEVYDCFSGNFFINDCSSYFDIFNSYLIGAKHVYVNCSSQLNDAYNVFLDSSGEIIELLDSRFPTTYGERVTLINKGLYPFDYDKSELIIDLRKETVTLQTVTLQTVTPQTVTCLCGCGSELFGRKKYFNSACRKRSQRFRANND